MADIIKYSNDDSDQLTSTPHQTQWIRKTLTPRYCYILLQLYTFNNQQQRIQYNDISVIELKQLFSNSIQKMYGNIGGIQYSIDIINTLTNNSNNNAIQYICRCDNKSIIPIRASLTLCTTYNEQSIYIDIIGCSTTLIGLTRLIDI